ncbi:MAG: hypothetical protein ACU836_14890 [Gammaproteobacteria bacterium]
MSNTQFAFLKKENIPGRKEWQESIDNLNFRIRLVLDLELTLLEDEGFSPCKWGDSEEDVGFEIYYEPSADICEGDEGLKKIVGDKDCCISFVWHGDIKDCAAVMVASCALAKDFGAVISYEGEAPESLEKLIHDAREIIAEVEDDG